MATLKPYELPVSTVYELVDVVTVIPSAILHQKARTNKIVKNIMQYGLRQFEELVSNLCYSEEVHFDPKQLQII